MGVVEWEMAGISREDSGVGSSTEGFSSGQQLCESGEALAEWRSSEQLENGTPSTSPPYWDTDDDDDCGRLFVSHKPYVLRFFVLTNLFTRHKRTVRRVIIVVFCSLKFDQLLAFGLMSNLDVIKGKYFDN